MKLICMLILSFGYTNDMNDEIVVDLLLKLVISGLFNSEFFTPTCINVL